MADNEVTIKILGDAQEFRKSVKEVSSVSTDLDKLTSKFRKNGLNDHKALSKITQRHNKSQGMGGKDALKLEQKLKKEMSSTIALMKKKQKMFKGDVAAIEDEVKALQKLAKEHKKVQDHRKKAGIVTSGEKLKGSGGSAAGAAMGIGKAIAGAVSYVGGYLVNALTSQIKSGYASFVNFGRSRAGLSGMGSYRGGIDLKGNASGVFGSAQKMGFSATETLQQMRGIGRQTGNINNVSLAQRAARSYGGDVGEVGGFMGTLTRAGQKVGGQGGERQFTRIMQHAFTGGLDKSRAGEHLSAVAQLVQSAQSVTGGSVDAASISGLLTFFSKSGFAGLQGAAGAAQMMKADSAIKKAGFNAGGDEWTSMMYQGAGFGSPGGKSSFYDATRQLQRGIADPANLMNMFQRANQVGGAGSERANLTLSRGTGMSLDVIEKMQKVIASGGGENEVLREIEKLAKEALPTDQQILNVNKEHLAVAQRVAFLDNRLVGIGMQAQKGVEAIEDIFNEVMDTLMPDAIKVLEMIAAILQDIWEGIKPFFAQFNKRDKAEGNLQDLSKKRIEVLSQLESGQISQAEAATKLRAISKSAGTTRGDLDVDSNFGKLLLQATHPLQMFHQAIGLSDEKETALERQERLENETRLAERRARIEARQISRGRSAQYASITAQIAEAEGQVGELRGTPRAQLSDDQALRMSQLETLLNNLRSSRDALGETGPPNPPVMPSVDNGSLRNGGGGEHGSSVTTNRGTPGTD